MIDIDQLEALAKSATPGPWEWDGRKQDEDGYVYIPECSYIVGGISLSFQHEEYQKDCDYIAAANPAAILELIAEVRRLREALSTPVAMKIRSSPIESHMIDGYSQMLADDAIKRGNKVIVYYGEVRHYRASTSTRACPKCGIKDLPAGAYCKGIDCPLNPAQAEEKAC